MGGKTKSKVETTQKREPWAPATPYIKGTIDDANKLRNSNIGTTYFPGATSVPMSFETAYGVDAIKNRAVNGSPLNAAAQNQLLGTINGDYFNPTNQFYNNGLAGGHQNTSAGLYQPLMDGNNSPANGYFQDIAGASSPHLDQTFDIASKKISDNVNSNFAKAGRYGSGAHQGILAEDLGNFANDLYGNAYQADQSRRLSAANAIQNSHNNYQNNYLNAAGSMSNLENQNIDRLYASANGLNQNFQNARSDQLNAIYGAGQVAANDYADYDQLLKAGAINENQYKNDLQSDLNMWQYLESAPGNKLAQLASYGPAWGNLGGVTNTDQLTTNWKTANIAGGITGAASGAQAGSAAGPWGAVAGGVLGGINGLF